LSFMRTCLAFLHLTTTPTPGIDVQVTVYNWTPVTEISSGPTWGTCTTSLRNCASYPRSNPRDIISGRLLSSRALPPAKYH
jgi:hypothetical protein